MARDRTSAANAISALQPKLSDPDADIRFMGLSDMVNILNSPGADYLRSENHTAARLVDALLKALKDGNGEVQNQALKCVAPLARKTPSEQILPFIDKIIDLTLEPEIDVSVPNAALRTLVSTLPQPHVGIVDKDARIAYQGISRVLIPRLVGYLPNEAMKSKAQAQVPKGLLTQQKDLSYSSDAVDVMIEVVNCYGSMLTETELVAMIKSAMHIIESPQAGGVVKKRALSAIGGIVVHLNDTQLSSFISTLVETFQKSGISANNRRFLISTVGTMARSISKRLGPYLNVLAPFVFDALSQEELEAGQSDDDFETDSETEELREAALITIETLLSSCPVAMQPHLATAVDCTLRCVKYDPNVADGDDEEMGGTQDGSDDGITEDTQEDEDDEYGELDDQDAFSDVDDMSWKVRRCAAKTLHTIVSGSSSNEYSALFTRVVPVLISRLNNEREDSVRLEIISATTALIQKAGSTRAGGFAHEASNGDGSVPNSRKRRREDSEVGTTDHDLKGLVQTRASPPIDFSSPPSGSDADLAMVVPKIVQAVVKLWKKASMALKQGAVVMLRAITTGRNGALADHLQQLEDPIADALKPSSTPSSGSATGSSATVASLQVETLLLISTITETNGNSVLIPFVIALIPSVTSIVDSRNYKVAVETLATIEQFVKAVTPPRLSQANQDHSIHLQKLYDVVIHPVLDMNTDLEIRHRAIQVLGVLIARTSSTGLLPQGSRTKALGVLSDRLKNETTRLESARAIGLIAEAAQPQDNIGSEWVQEVTLEMANQLRKVDRSLRGSCLEAIQYMALNPTTAAQYDTNTIQQLQALLMPLISPDDLHLLTPALVILSRIIPTNAQAFVTDDVVKSLCLLTRARLEGPPLKAYLLVVKVVGEQGVGNSLMTGFLATGTDGETMVLGRAIGTLIVHGGPKIGVTIEAFVKEVESATDIRARCLALTVLGEVGLRRGASFQLGLDIFIKNLSADSEKVRLSAAVALGSASSSNISQSMPLILSSFGSTAGQDYLYLHALKEILQHSESAASDIAPYASELWQKLFAVADAEDNRAVGSECLGRLATIEPSTYVPELTKSLQDPKATIRGTVIAAFRFTLSDTSKSYNSILASIIIDLLKTMLTDADISNRRLAITTLNAAVHNKPELVIPEIGQLFPIVLADSFIKPDLIKTVKIGPFTHQEDSGLDLRKAAYSTMYTLLDSPRAVPQLSIPAVFDRILDGIPDDHDIRTLCNLMLQRLIVIDPSETRRRLSALAEKFKIVLGAKLKENAVKQEIERINEANSAVVRISLELERAFPSASTGEISGDMLGWKTYLDTTKKEHANLVRSNVNDG